MINFKKSTGKIGKIKKDYGINLDTVINKNLEIDDTDLDGEKVMMNLDKGEYFMMNEVGSRIWEIISEPINVKEIISTLRNEYEVDEETCKDIVQEAFIKYWRQENNFNDEIALKTYLYKSIRNGCLNQLRHENVRKKYFESLPDDWESEDYFMENVIKEEVANIVLQEINKLSETSRKILFKALDGYSNEEIAEELGVSVNTVKTHKARSYIMLRQNLGHLRILLFLLF